jgi:hypothetical protein
MAYSDFRASFKDMARANRFEITQTGPLSEPLLIKSAALPGSETGSLEVWHEGKSVKLAGDKIYNDWEVTCYLDNQGTLWKEMHDWSRLGINDLANVGATNKEDYKFDMELQMLTRSGEGITGTKFLLIGAYPKIINQIDLDHSSNDTVAEFSVTFSFDVYEQK